MSIPLIVCFAFFSLRSFHTAFVSHILHFLSMDHSTVVYDDPLAHESPAFYCKFCFKPMHTNPVDGSLTRGIQTMPYAGE